MIEWHYEQRLITIIFFVNIIILERVLRALYCTLGLMYIMFIII